MAKRRTSGVQRRSRASDEAMQRRLGAGRSLDMRIVAIVGFLLVGVVAVGFALVSLGPACSEFCGTRQADEGGSHVQDGTAGITYKSVPATSGPHWIDPANWGVYGPGEPGAYAAPPPESQALHNLEHGGIEIWYQPTKVDPDGLQGLINYVRSQVGGQRFKFIIAPWSGQDFGHPIAVTAWNWLLYLDEPNVDAVKQSADAHYGKAPEPNGGPGPPAIQ
jgi:hypothetical protein